MVDLFRYKHWDLVSKRWVYYVISLVLLGVGMVALFTHGLNLGIDFKGGGLVNYRVEGQLTNPPQIIGQLRDELKSAGIENEVQISPSGLGSSGDQLIIRTLKTTESNREQSEVLDSQIKDTITPTVEKVLKENNLKLAPGQQPEGKEMVSPTVQRELINQGVFALILGSLLIMAWIWFRYNIGGFGLRYSAAGILALLHDLLTLVGMFAIMRGFLQVNSPFIAALLTVLGYSIHDTIVIFDRIRENMRLRKGRTFAETVNISLLETMARSVNTILTVLFTLLALIFFGGPTLRDFTAAMLIGVIVGGYSSIFVASQLLVSWSKKEEKAMLPAEAPVAAAVPVTGKAAPAAQPVTAAAPAPKPEIGVAPTVATTPASRDAVQRARQAGKTSKRRR